MSNVTTSPSGAGTELGYISSASDFNTASTSLVDVTNVTVTVAVSGPVKIIVDLPFVSNSNATGATHFALLRGSTTIREAYCKILTAAGGTAVHFECRENPTPGSYTYKLQMCAVTAGTSTITASLGTDCSIQVLKV